MSDAELPPIEDPGAAPRWRLESVNPTMAIAGGVILLCLGIWVGFKLAGGEVLCPECAEKAHNVMPAAPEPEPEPEPAEPEA